MTEEENNVVLAEIEKEISDHDYIYFWSKDDVCLDGNFTKRELEVIVSHMGYEGEYR
jgi:hypothetical protein